MPSENPESIERTEEKERLDVLNEARIALNKLEKEVRSNNKYKT